MQKTATARAGAQASNYLDRGRRLEREVDPYLPGLTREAAAKLAGTTLDDIVKLSSNENPLGASPKAKAEVERLTSRLHEYPSPTADAVREAIGRYLGVDAAQVVVGAGSSTLMHGIVAAFTLPGGEVLSLDPSFSVYSEIAIIQGRKAVTVALSEGDFRLDLARLEVAITPRTQLIFLTRPNNPTSTLIPLGDFEQAARMAAEVGALIVSDEAYIEFAEVPAPSAVALIRGVPVRYPNVMVTRTFSKAFGLANLRLGYAIGTRETARCLALANAKWPTGAVAQAAGVAALADKEHLARTLQVVADGRRWLKAEFERARLPVVPAPQGNYVMVDVALLGLTAQQFSDRVFAAARVIIRGDFSERYVRVSIGTGAENARLMQAVWAIVQERVR
ncbi:MAG: pyridoxal phosphate-dependent aminotransferase [Alphaproteobacteria bacterium]